MTEPRIDPDELAWLEARERGAPAGEHPRAAGYRRLGEDLAALPSPASPEGWEARVLAKLDAPVVAGEAPVVRDELGARRRRWSFVAGGAVAAAAIAILIVTTRPAPKPEDAGLPAGDEIVIAVKRGDEPVRGDGRARRGDRLEVRVRLDGPGALWLYREDVLVVRCPGDRECVNAAGVVGIDHVLAAGVYRAVVVRGEAPPSTGSLDRDAQAVRAAGARFEPGKPLAVD